MKIALFTGFGINKFPSFLKVEGVGIEKRVNLAKEISKLPIMHNEPTFDDRRDLEQGKVKYFHYLIKGEEGFIFNERHELFNISIVDIDTSKPWKIVDYDGAESIEYFEGVKVLDEKYNLCEW